VKIFLTGATGILGTDIAVQLQCAGHEVLGFNSTNINIGDYNDVKQKVWDYSPDIVIHSAAMTNVDLCEDDKCSAVLINIIGSQNLSRAASSVNAKIIYISSCGVYGNGKSEPYNELDIPKPQTYHHYTKLEGELRVKEHNNNFLIIRPGWLFGGTLQHRKNFVEARRKEALTASVLKSAIDKVGSPTYTVDLAKQLITLISADQGGTFNIVNEGSASRFDYVSEIVKVLGLETVVEPVNSNEFPRKANMPDNEVLENLYLNLNQINSMRSWKDALKDYIISSYHQ
jgi:dTDP-4-dehydrorhamnose reductase